MPVPRMASRNRYKPVVANNTLYIANKSVLYAIVQGASTPPAEPAAN